MANKITGKEFEAVKNAGYTVISFNAEGKRTMTFGGASLINAMQEMVVRGRMRHTCLVINDKQAKELGIKIPWGDRIEDYAELFNVKWEVL
jgi:hypothetical protein